MIRFDVTWNYKAFILAKRAAPAYKTLQLRPCLVRKILVFGYRSIFVFIWQTLSNHRVTSLKRLISQITGNCTISFYFRLYLMLHVCDQRFDVTRNLENFCELDVKIFWISLP